MNENDNVHFIMGNYIIMTHGHDVRYQFKIVMFWPLVYEKPP